MLPLRLRDRWRRPCVALGDAGHRRRGHAGCLADGGGAGVRGPGSRRRLPFHRHGRRYRGSRRRIRGDQCPWRAAVALRARARPAGHRPSHQPALGRRALHPPGVPEGDPPVGPQQTAHELLQHPRRAGEPVSRGRAAERPAAPDPRSGPRRRLLHHHAQPPGAARGKRSNQGAVPQRAGVAESSTAYPSATKSGRSAAIPRASRCCGRSARFS